MAMQRERGFWESVKERGSVEERKWVLLKEQEGSVEWSVQKVCKRLVAKKRAWGTKKKKKSGQRY
jgi:hypothetical protein